MPEQFKVGDTVQHQIVCVYFDADNKLQTAGFRREGLKKVADF